jgi:hypothetical protein
VCSFRSGNYNTQFIPLNYPDGFFGVQLSDRETEQLVACAALLHQSRLVQSLSEDDPARYDNSSGECVVVLPGHAACE